MRAMWKGAVTFGLVSIPVRLYAATEEKDVRFNQVHNADGERIRYRRVCSGCHEEVAHADIAKGYDIGGGELVMLSDEDLADLPLSSARTIDVVAFVPAAQLDPMMYDRAYYVEPEGPAAKPYVLLCNALVESGRVGVVKVALRQRERLATLWAREGVLVLNTVLWPDEIRAPELQHLPRGIRTTAAEQAMAGTLVEAMATDFDARVYTDDYRLALEEVIRAKVEGRAVVTGPPHTEEAVTAVDLMAALRASVERAKAAREVAIPARLAG